MKYFLISDIHSFAKEMKTALRQAGYSKKNKEHTLVVLGDVFDRGMESVEVYKYLSTIPKSRLVLIKGNHEDLYNELLNKYFPEGHDFSNGTVRTFCNIAGFDEKVLSGNYWSDLDRKENGTYTGLFDNKPQEYWQQIVEIVKQHQITKWLFSNQWKDYFEINNKFVCVHSFIPINVSSEVVGTLYEHWPTSELSPNLWEYKKDWRNSTDYEWSEARWGCPWQQYELGLFKDKNETLICGHWHTSDFFKNLQSDYHYEGTNAPIYYEKGLIGIDGGVTLQWYIDDDEKLKRKLVHPQNVLVIDENNICYDKYGNKLKAKGK